MPTVKPVRIQRLRKKGWTVVSATTNGLETVYVGRGTRFGNPFVVGKDGTLDEVLAKYVHHIFPYTHGAKSIKDYETTLTNSTAIIAELKGKNLMCWCKLDCKCHADILLKVANQKHYHAAKFQ
jgi:hypothetical protein